MVAPLPLGGNFKYDVIGRCLLNLLIESKIITCIKVASVVSVTLASFLTTQCFLFIFCS
uniref:Uncharacterized protein n=1 Tax=Rhizophora mucronata TaxID=61149 RepID=A0A2P2N134_RHIMU